MMSRQMSRVLSAEDGCCAIDYDETEVHTSRWRLFLRLAKLSSPASVETVNVLLMTLTGHFLAFSSKGSFIPNL